MRKISLIIFSTLLLNSLSYAQQKKGPVEMRAVIIDPYIQPQSFPKHVQMDSHSLKMAYSREFREAQFEKLKLKTHVDRLDFDELDRDLLYINLKKHKIDRIIKKYPQIPEAVLKFAKNNI